MDTYETYQDYIDSIINRVELYDAQFVCNTLDQLKQVPKYKFLFEKFGKIVDENYVLSYKEEGKVKFCPETNTVDDFCIKTGCKIFIEYNENHDYTTTIFNCGSNAKTIANVLSSYSCLTSLFFIKWQEEAYKNPLIEYDESQHIVIKYSCSEFGYNKYCSKMQKEKKYNEQFGQCSDDELKQVPKYKFLFQQFGTIIDGKYILHCKEQGELTIAEDLIVMFEYETGCKLKLIYDEHSNYSTTEFDCGKSFRTVANVFNSQHSRNNLFSNAWRTKCMT